MKKINKIIWLLGVILFMLSLIFALQNHRGITKVLSQGTNGFNLVNIKKSLSHTRAHIRWMVQLASFDDRINRLDSRNNNNKRATAESQRAQSITPIESLVNNADLNNTYYYHYSKEVPNTVKKAFNRAIRTYNTTKIVSLKAGKATIGQNELTLGTYHNNSSHNGSVELGHGGPEVRLTLFNTGNSVNHGRAKLNTAYLGSLNTAVAIHEVGHALGLSHSNDIKSVMYPIEQGQTRLTPDDLKALNQIYQMG